MQDLRNRISELSDYDFEQLLSWILSEEREDRKLRERSRTIAAEIRQEILRDLRESGFQFQEPEPEPTEEA